MTTHQDSQLNSAAGGTDVQQSFRSILRDGTFVLIGLLLLFAGAAKTYQLYTEPLELSALAVAIPLVMYEFWLGIWLVLGSRTRWTWWTTFMTLAAFMCGSAYKMVSQAESCGCFGRIEVRPQTMFVIDGAVLLALVTCACKLRPVSREDALASLRRVAPYALGLGLMLISAAVSGQSSVQRLDGRRLSPGGLVVLEPNKWVGQPLALLSHIDIGQRLALGTWDVLLFRSDCEMCHDVMRDLSSRLDKKRGGSIALVAVDQRTDDALVSRLRDQGCAVGQLSSEYSWFVTTPVHLRIVEGKCTKVVMGDSGACCDSIEIGITEN